MNTKILIVTLFHVAIARQLADRGQREALIYFEPQIEQYDDNEYVLTKHDTDNRNKIVFPTSEENNSRRHSNIEYSSKPGRLDHRFSSVKSEDATEAVTENDKIIFKDDDNPEPYTSVTTPNPDELNKNDKFYTGRKKFNDLYYKKVSSQDTWNRKLTTDKTDELSRSSNDNYKELSEESSENTIEAVLVFPGDSSPTKIRLDLSEFFTTTGRNPYGIYNRASFYIPCDPGEVRIYGACVCVWCKSTVKYKHNT